MTDAGRGNYRALHELARAHGRTILVDGTEWRVYELPPGMYDRRGPATLVFESHDIFRRIRNYPSDWRELTDEALYAASLRV
jgi:hypothetical protein